VDRVSVAPPRDRAEAPASAARAAASGRECRTGYGHSPGVGMVVQLFDCILRNAPWGVSL